MSEDKNKAGHENDLHRLHRQLQDIEKLRRSQSRLRASCLLIALGCVGMMGLTIYKSYRGINKDRFVSNLQEELKNEFSPELMRLAQKSKQELLPQFQKELVQSLDERLPKIKDRLSKSLSEKRTELDAKVEKHVLRYFEEFRNEVERQLPEQDLHLVFTKMKKMEEQIIEDLSHRVRERFQTIKPKMDRVDQDLKSLAASSQVQQLSTEEAKDMFLEAVIDLFKYEIIPNSGEVTTEAKS